MDDQSSLPLISYALAECEGERDRARHVADAECLRRWESSGHADPAREPLHQAEREESPPGPGPGSETVAQPESELRRTGPREQWDEQRWRESGGSSELAHSQVGGIRCGSAQGET